MGPFIRAYDLAMLLVLPTIILMVELIDDSNQHIEILCRKKRNKA